MFYLNYTNQYMSPMSLIPSNHVVLYTSLYDSLFMTCDRYYDSLYMTCGRYVFFLWALRFLHTHKKTKTTKTTVRHNIGKYCLRKV